MTDYCAFIPYVNRPDLLKKAVDSSRSIHPRVIDNSKTGEGARLYWSMYPPVPLSFSQTMNLMLRETRDNGAVICIWMHSDAEAAPGTCTELLRLAREYTASGRKWGVLFTNYDALSAINMTAADDVGEWDTNLQWYASDCDWYYRMKLCGWELVETNLPVYHEPSQTLKADPLISAQVNAMFPYRTLYYAQKWGGNPGHEVFTRPFNLP